MDNTEDLGYCIHSVDNKSIYVDSSLDDFGDRLEIFLDGRERPVRLEQPVEDDRYPLVVTDFSWQEIVEILRNYFSANIRDYVLKEGFERTTLRIFTRKD